MLTQVVWELLADGLSGRAMAAHVLPLSDDRIKMLFRFPDESSLSTPT